MLIILSHRTKAVITIDFYWRGGLYVKTSDHIFELMDDGTAPVFLSNLIEFRVHDWGTTEIVTLSDSGQLEYWADHHDGEESFVIARDVTAACVTSYLMRVIFTTADGLTYIVDLENYGDVRYSIKIGDKDAAYLYQLGNESVEYYLSEYGIYTEEYFTDDKWRGTENNPFNRLVRNYCSTAQ